MANILGIDWAPVTTPWRRRLQTAAVFYFTADFLVAGFIALVVLVSLLWTSYFWVTCLYVVWWVYDKQTCNRGGRRRRWARWLPSHKWFRDYFPIKLVKVTKLQITQRATHLLS